MLRPRVTRATAQLTALCCARRAGGCAPGRPHGARQSEPRESCTRPCPCWPQRAHRGNGLGLGPLRPLLSTSLLSATSVLPLRDRSVLLLSPCQPSPSPHSPDSSGALGVACERAGQRPCRRRRGPCPAAAGGQRRPRFRAGPSPGWLPRRSAVGKALGASQLPEACHRAFVPEGLALQEDEERLSPQSGFFPGFPASKPSVGQRRGRHRCVCPRDAVGRRFRLSHGGCGSQERTVCIPSGNWASGW